MHFTVISVLFVDAVDAERWAPGSPVDIHRFGGEVPEGGAGQSASARALDQATGQDGRPAQRREWPVHAVSWQQDSKLFILEVNKL